MTLINEYFPIKRILWRQIYVSHKPLNDNGNDNDKNDISNGNNDKRVIIFPLDIISSKKMVRDVTSSQSGEGFVPADFPDIMDLCCEIFFT